MRTRILQLLWCALISLMCLPRAYSTIFVVNSAGDGVDVTPTDTICDDASGMCTFRAAIMTANFKFGRDTIVFNIAPGGLTTIIPNSQLPALTDLNGVLIDGLSQPDGLGGQGVCLNDPTSLSLFIQLDGSATAGIFPPVHGLHIISPYNEVSGLIISNFDGDGIRIEGGGGLDNHADHNVITCNMIGTDPSGMNGSGNGRNLSVIHAGVTIKNIGDFGTADHNIVDNNLISGNDREGVQIIGPIQPGSVRANQVLGNFIGSDKLGLAAIPNARQGVNLSEGTTDNLIDNNLISGNGWDGIGLQGFDNIPFPLAFSIFTRRNTISNNRIGVDNSSGTPQALGNGNHGIAIGLYWPNSTWGYADSNDVIQNTIWYNGGDGIAIWEHKQPDPMAFPFANADHNYLSQNSLWLNAGMGIDLENDGITYNDGLADADNLANQLLNFPYNISMSVVGDTATISGMTDPSAVLVELYTANDSVIWGWDSSAYGEGQIYIGSAVPTGGFWTLKTTAVGYAHNLSSIAHDAQRNTSEFGPNYAFPLAIDLSSFKVLQQNDHVEITWSVQDQSGVKGYTVQRALDGVDFKSIGSVEADPKTMNYVLSDQRVGFAPVHYYRLEIVNNEPPNTLSPIELAVFEGGKFRLFPNPASNGVFFVTLAEPATGDYALYDSRGLQVSTGGFDEQATVRIEAPAVPGYYFLCIKFPNHWQTFPVQVTDVHQE